MKREHRELMGLVACVCLVLVVASLVGALGGTDKKAGAGAANSVKLTKATVNGNADLLGENPQSSVFNVHGGQLVITSSIAYGGTEKAPDGADCKVWKVRVVATDKGSGTDLGSCEMEVETGGTMPLKLSGFGTLRFDSDRVHMEIGVFTLARPGNPSRIMVDMTGDYMMKNYLEQYIRAPINGTARWAVK